MTYETLATIMDSMADAIGGESVYLQFEESCAPEPPYLVFYFKDSSDFYADSMNYKKIRPLAIELYTDRKNPAIEEILERELTEHGFTYSRGEGDIPSERLHEVYFNTEVIIDG